MTVKRIYRFAFPNILMETFLTIITMAYKHKNYDIWLQNHNASSGHLKYKKNIGIYSLNIPISDNPVHFILITELLAVPSPI